MAKIEFQEVPFQTIKGVVEGKTELVVLCPKNVSKVNVKKSCSKCPMKNKLSYKEKYVDCKLAK